MKAETREKIKANWQLFKESLPIFLPSQVLLLLAAVNLYVPMRRTMHGVLLILRFADERPPERRRRGDCDGADHARGRKGAESPTRGLRHLCPHRVLHGDICDGFGAVQQLDERDEYRLCER